MIELKPLFVKSVVYIMQLNVEQFNFHKFEKIL
jgi:hypothetical protein